MPGFNSQPNPKPAITITEKGAVTLNKSAVEKFRLKDFPYVLLAYEPKTALLLVDPQKEKVRGVIALRYQVTGQATFGCKKFLLEVKARPPSATTRQNLDGEENISCLLR